MTFGIYLPGITFNAALHRAGFVADGALHLDDGRFELDVLPLEGGRFAPP